MGARVLLGLCLLEGLEDAVPDLDCRIQALQPRSELRELVVTEVAVRGTGGEDQVVVRRPAPAAGRGCWRRPASSPGPRRPSRP